MSRRHATSVGGGGPAEGEQQWGPYVGSLDKPDLLQVRSWLRAGPC